VTDGPPTQAVILAGGQGTRLKPLTDSIPKPLVPVNDRPFLSYLLQQVKSQGIQDVLVLVGYLADQVREFCGDGSQWGLNITCVESPLEAETGQRLSDVASLLDSHFLLMYCDNYWPMDLPRMWDAYRKAGTPAMITVYSNRDGYSRANVRVDDGGLVTAYDPGRSSPDLNGVEIGYALLNNDVVAQIPSGNARFEHTVYPTLSERSALAAFTTDHRYYGVGSFERLKLTEAFFEPQKAVILDRDGVLNERPPIAHYVRSWDEFHWLPGSIEAMRHLKTAGYKLALASNQSGIARGLMTEEDLAEVHRRMKADLEAGGVTVDAIYHCSHGWDDGCFCRKPSPGMLFQAQQEFNLDLTKTLFIGDDERDEEAGKAAGCLTELVTEERNLLDVVQEYLSKQGATASCTHGRAF
jgi:histidinol-phosphate phosphatase family protein